MNKDLLQHHIKLHIIVFILGFTAILGKLISVEAIPLVFYRTLIAAATIGAYVFITHRSLRLPPKAIFQLVGIGVVVAAHWIAFFHAIKVSNVSVTLSCLATGTLFTSLMEPLSQRRKISWLEVIVGVVIIFAVYLIYQFETRYLAGILFAVLAAFLSSAFSVLNKNIAHRYDIHAITFWEMLSGFVMVALFMVLTQSPSAWSLELNASDVLWLTLLATVCTAYAFVQTVGVMKKLSAYIVVLVINLEPVYGIILGYFIFGDSERMTPGFYAGTLVLLAAVFSYPVLLRLLQRQRTNPG